jgi:hypothetical protein
MRERERLGSLLEMYDSALNELMTLGDPAVDELILRLELWRTAAELELMFEAERGPGLPLAGGPFAKPS